MVLEIGGLVCHASIEGIVWVTRCAGLTGLFEHADHHHCGGKS